MQVWMFCPYSKVSKKAKRNQVFCLCYCGHICMKQNSLISTQCDFSEISGWWGHSTLYAWSRWNSIKSARRYRYSLKSLEQWGIAQRCRTIITSPQIYVDSYGLLLAYYYGNEASSRALMGNLIVKGVFCLVTFRSCKMAPGKIPPEQYRKMRSDWLNATGQTMASRDFCVLTGTVGNVLISWTISSATLWSLLVANWDFDS